MIHCQHCGVTNDLVRPTCRVCGGVLAIERGTRPCPSCQELTGEGAAFCHACGTVVLGAADALLDESVMTPRWVEADPVGRSGSEAASGSTADGDLFGIGGALELPEWLLRAANETPASATATDVAIDLGPGFVVAAKQPVPAPEPPADDDTAFDLGVDRVVEPSRSVPPVADPRQLPVGNLAETMPSWLRATADPVAADVVTEPPGVDPEGDPTDTQSFIGENDLPDWLRQIAASDAVKAAADQVAAAESQTAATAPVAVGFSPDAVLAQADRPAAASAGGWLSRAASAPAATVAWGQETNASRGSAFADVVASGTAAAGSAPVDGSGAVAFPTERVDAPDAKRRPMLDRRVLLGLVAAAVVLALLMMTGAFG